MKTLLAVMILSVACFGQAEEQVKAAHAEFVKAAKAGDEAALKRLLADEVQYSHSNTLLENKTVAVAALVKTKPTFDVTDEQIKVYGKTATIRAKVISKATPPINMTVLLVWVKNGKQWQLVQRQTTRVPAT